MDKPVYCVFKLVDGQSIQVGNATDSYDDAYTICRATFNQHHRRCPVKVVESKVVHDVVFSLSPPTFHVSVSVPSKGTITHYRTELAFLAAVRDLISQPCRFDVVSHYD